MPNHKTHIAVGIVAAGALLYIIHYFSLVDLNLPLWKWIVAAVVVILYAQLPDVDADASKVNKLWNTVAAAVALVVLIIDSHNELGILAVLSILLLEQIPHRGPTHDAWFGVVASAPLWFVEPIIAMLGFTAYISHLLIDGELGRR